MLYIRHLGGEYRFVEELRSKFVRLDFLFFIFFILTVLRQKPVPVAIALW